MSRIPSIGVWSRGTAGTVGLLVAAGSSLGQTPCPRFTAGPAAQTIVVGQSAALTLSVESGATFVTNDGTIDVDLMLNSAPNTSANFLNYVRSGRYNGVMFHRSLHPLADNVFGLVQTGGYTTPSQPMAQPTPPLPDAQRPQPIVTDASIAIEHAVGNVRGAVAMWHDPFTLATTSQFFINTIDNNQNMPNVRGSFDAEGDFPGYSVFGTATPETMDAVDAINHEMTYTMSPLFGGEFPATPLRVAAGEPFTFPMPTSVYVTIATATVIQTPVSSWPGSAGWSYRWRRNGVDLVDGERIGGSGTGDLSIADMSVEDSGTYQCVVTGLTCSGATVISNPVTLVCPADLGVAGGTLGADGALDNNDFIAFIILFFGSSPKADLGRAGGLAGGDGAFDNNDFIAFVDRFFQGC